MAISAHNDPRLLDMTTFETQNLSQKLRRSKLTGLVMDPRTAAVAGSLSLATDLASSADSVPNPEAAKGEVSGTALR